MSEYDKVKYNTAYNKKTYKTFTFRLRKDEAEKITEFIKNHTDLSVNAFIKEAVDEKIAKMSKKV